MHIRTNHYFCSSIFGMWRSLVAYAHGVRVVAGSNPVIPTNKIQRKSVGFLICGKLQFTANLEQIKNSAQLLS